MIAAIRLIKEERERQIAKWGNGHDDMHTHDELTDAACYYALADSNDAENLYPIHWCDSHRNRDKKTRFQQLVIAGALIVAEIERLERLKESVLTDIEEKYKTTLEEGAE